MGSLWKLVAVFNDTGHVLLDELYVVGGNRSRQIPRLKSVLSDLSDSLDRGLGAENGAHQISLHVHLPDRGRFQYLVHENSVLEVLKLEFVDVSLEKVDDDEEDLSVVDRVEIR